MKFPRTYHLLCAWYVAFFVPIIHAQRASIKVGDVTFTLGESETHSIALLKQNYVVAEVVTRTGHISMVSRKPDRYVLAMIYSRGGLIVGVSHDLVEHDAKSIDDAFDALFRAASHLKETQSQPCTPQTTSSYNADTVLPLSKTGVFFDCGAYSFYLLRNTYISEGQTVSAFVAEEEIGITE